MFSVVSATSSFLPQFLFVESILRITDPAQTEVLVEEDFCSIAETTELIHTIQPILFVN